jgi:iron complex transport system ATP-binding protein
MSKTVIQISNLRLSISGKEILKGISLDVHKGDFVSIIGPNGAGKTTMIKCISRVYTNWTGSISVNGKDIHKIPQRELARQISYVPQAEGRSLPFTAFEFVLMGRYPHLSPFTSVSGKDKQLVEETMEMAGVLQFRDRRLNTLSGGERQMVFIAAALAQGADILLLDEPASFLDYKHQVQVIQLLSHLHRERNITVVSVSHDINTAIESSSRIAALQDGSVLFNGTPEETADPAILEKIYGTTFQFTSAPHRPLPLITPGGAA